MKRDLMFYEYFEDSIVVGRKTHTIRTHRKAEVGDILVLRTPDHIICEVVCSSVSPVRISNNGVELPEQSIFATSKEIESFALHEGFRSWSEMSTWFDVKYNILKKRFMGYLIEWSFIPVGVSSELLK